MGLFDKKYCDVCGEKIGLLGNRKLEDANLCKNCAKKLSPWFSERRHSTLAEIKEQLAYREENKKAVAAFHTTRSLGKDTKILFDEDARKFMVTRARDLEEANPDVMDFTQVTGCDLDVDENRSELKRKDSEGKMVSYIPPRYEYSYDFNMIIRVNTPYFDEIRFRLNDSTVRTGERSINMSAAAAMQRPNYGAGAMHRPESKRTAVDAVMNALANAANGGTNRVWNAEYQSYLDMADEIKATLMEARQMARDEIASQNAPKQKVLCPYCGASTIPDANGCCEYCGAPVEAG